MLERGITLILFVDAILTMSRTFNLCSCTSMRDLRFQIRQVLSPSAAEASLFLSEMGWDAMYIAYGLHRFWTKKVPMLTSHRKRGVKMYISGH